MTVGVTVGVGVGVPGGPNAVTPFAVTGAEPLGESAEVTETLAMPLCASSTSTT